MSFKIERDQERFKKIVNGKIKENLRKYMSNEDMLGKKGKNIVSIPLPQIRLPRFTHGDNGGVGQGPGQPGDGAGTGEPGKDPGEHMMEVEVNMNLLADLMGEELELPKILPKGKKNIESPGNKYTSVRKIGPESLRHFKRTYKEALKRTISLGEYDPEKPLIYPIKDDKRFRSAKPISIPLSQAVVFYLMDISGSMSDEQKRLSRTISFWIDTWLRRNYKNLDSKYIVHDTEAKEVTEKQFYYLKEAGGTDISSAYALTDKLISSKYPIQDWNIYVFQYSDGDDLADHSRANELLQKLLGVVNQVSYCQVRESGSFYNNLESMFSGNEKLVMTKCVSQDTIYDVIKTFFKKGN